MTAQEPAIPKATLANFREGVLNQCYGQVLMVWGKAQCRGDTVEALAGRLNEPVANVAAWLASPKDWTIEIMAELGLALGFYWGASVQPRPLEAASDLPKESDKP